MNVPNDKAAVPKGGLWKWVCPETGYTIMHPYYAQVKRDVKAYLVANNYPIGLQFDDEFDANLCANAAAGVCSSFEPPTLLDKANSVTRALAKWALSGFKVREESEVNAIVALCRECPFYGGETGVLKIACKKCGCSKLKLYLRTSHCPDNPRRW